MFNFRTGKGASNVTNLFGILYTSNDLSFSLFSVIDSCVKTIGVHDRVFDVNDKVDNTLEPRG